MMPSSAADPPAPREGGVVVAAIDMGYGHLRAALPLVEALGADLVEVDRPPVASADERRLWLAARGWYERTSRISQLPVVGAPMRALLESVTAIEHLHPYRDQSRPDRGARALHRLARMGMGRGLARLLDERHARLLATYFSAALSADVHGARDIDCVVTDADIARAWAPLDGKTSRVRYLAPTQRAVRRLLAYGVPRERVRYTGFPLPPSLLGGEDLRELKRNLAARLVRLDPSGWFREARRREIEAALGPLPPDSGAPLHLVFAVGGAGAQSDLPSAFLPSLAPLVRAGRLRVTLSAGTRHDVAATFEAAIARAGLARDSGVSILHAAEFRDAYARFNEALIDADVLWTKPSELTFYGALGLPLVLGSPVGVHERYNRRHARERGAGLKQRDARHAGQWLMEWLEEGVLAAAALSGHLMLPASGTYRIAEVMHESRAGAT